MNDWMIDRDLGISKEEVKKRLHEIIQSFEKPDSSDAKFVGKILGDNFEVIIKRSLIWGMAFRKLVEGTGSVVESNNGSRITASFQVCAPYRYVNLNRRKWSIIVPIFVMSWIGLVISNIWVKYLSFLDYLLIPSFFITGFVLLTGLQRYMSIDDKFKEVIDSFEKTFDSHRIIGS